MRLKEKEAINIMPQLLFKLKEIFNIQHNFGTILVVLSPCYMSLAFPLMGIYAQRVCLGAWEKAYLKERELICNNFLI